MKTIKHTLWAKMLYFKDGSRQVLACIATFCLKLCLVLLCLTTIAHAQSSESANNSINAKPSAKTSAIGASILGDDKTTRIILSFNNKPNYRLFYMQKPNRFVIELDNTKFAFKDKSTLKPFGLIANARFGAITSSKSRIVLTLDKPAKLTSQDLQVSKDENNKSRLVFELSAITQLQFSEQLERQVSLLGASGNSAVKGDRVRVKKKKEGVFTVVIDAGHGGIDGGAVGKNKTLEKNITLLMSNLVGKELKELGTFKVVYTRQKDVFMSLKRRLAFTKRQHADLLVSIHADTLKQKNVRGATIYTLAKRASDKLAQEVATSENLTDIVAGLAAPEAKDEVSDILADLTLRETTKFSKAFSQALVNRMKSNITLIKNPQRSASFVVLKNADVPSVLLELGYLSNAEDEAMLNDSVWQKNAAKKISLAITDFFKPRMNQVSSN